MKKTELLCLGGGQIVAEEWQKYCEELWHFSQESCEFVLESTDSFVLLRFAFAQEGRERREQLTRFKQESNEGCEAMEPIRISHLGMYIHTYSDICSCTAGSREA